MGDYVEDDGKKQSTERIVKSRPLKIAPAVTTKTPMSKKSHTSTHTQANAHTNATHMQHPERNCNVRVYDQEQQSKGKITRVQCVYEYV